MVVAGDVDVDDENAVRDDCRCLLALIWTFSYCINSMDVGVRKTANRKRADLKQAKRSD